MASIPGPLSELADFLNTTRFEGYWQWIENSGQVWEGSLHVFPVSLSFSMLLSNQLIMESSGLFFLTATHSDGVTQTSTTEPALSEAQHTARPRPAAGSHIGEGLCQSDCY